MTIATEITRNDRPIEQPLRAYNGQIAALLASDADALDVIYAVQNAADQFDAATIGRTVTEGAFGQPAGWHVNLSRAARKRLGGLPITRIECATLPEALATAERLMVEGA